MLIHDPHVFRLWSRLHQVAAAVGQVHVWYARDGARSPDQAFQHAVPTLVACLDGVVRVSGAPRRRLDLQPGEVLVLAPGTWHRHEPLRLGSAAFAQGFVAGWSDIVLTTAHDHLVGGIPSQPCRRLIERVVDGGPGGGRDAERRRLVGECLRQVLSEQVHPPQPMPPALLRMAVLVWYHDRPGLNAADVVAASGLGHSQAYAMFRGYFGMGPKQYLTARRLALALQLLREGAGIAAAARDSGFASRADLTRAFRRRHGCPPSGWAGVADAEEAPVADTRFVHQPRLPRGIDALTRI